MFSILNLVFAVCILGTLNAQNAPADYQGEGSGAGWLLCDDLNCTNEERPVCSWVGYSGQGVLITDVNKCHYKQRSKCYKAKNQPISFLHDGLCRGTECPGRSPRIYDPVCSSVDGIPETDDNKWKFEIKKKCAQDFRAQENTNSPVVNFLHAEACLGNEHKCWRKCWDAVNHVCSVVNGYLVTEKNSCIHKNKKRCNDMLKKEGKDAATINFLHNGRCRGNELECEISCPRNYHPICSSLNGRLRTENNPCLLEKKIGCDKRLRDLGRKDVPTRLFEYDGACKNEVQNKSPNVKNVKFQI